MYQNICIKIRNSRLNKKVGLLNHMNREDNVYLLLGSNIGDRDANLLIAVDRLHSSFGNILRLSSTYVSAPWGKQDQPEFLNSAIQLSTRMTPMSLLSGLKALEGEMGRTKGSLWDKRLIDIDILLFGSSIMATDDLTIPHPHLPDRRFALTPLAEIAPAFVHPVLGRSILQLLEDCLDPLRVSRATN
jgi:2-amino-4-hydroxy-6-hydroxymethyldihydropteridine diphosphokinase